MSTHTHAPVDTHAHGHGHDHGGHHAPTGFFRRYVFSTDHKVIGLQFTFVSLLFVVLGGLLALGVRYQLAWPNQNVPYAGITPTVENNAGPKMTQRAPESNLALWHIGDTVEFNKDFEVNGRTIPAGAKAKLKGFPGGFAVTVPAETMVTSDLGPETILAATPARVAFNAVIGDYDYARQDVRAPQGTRVVLQSVGEDGKATDVREVEIVSPRVRRPGSTEPVPTGRDALLPIRTAATVASISIGDQIVGEGGEEGEARQVAAVELDAVPADTLSWYKQVLTADAYLTLFTMHATIMIFFVLMPMLLGGFGNFLIPLMIGARDMAFPRLNAFSFWLSVPAGLIMLASFWVPQGAAGGGWTMYPTLSGANMGTSLWGTNLWLISIFIVGFSTIVGTLNYITTIINMRAPGMTMFRMPLTVWSLFVTAVLALLATPVLAAAAIMLLLDRTIGTMFFIPEHGGQPLLWQHLFWFFGHPEVYILILPAMGIASDVLSTFSRKPVFGYKPMVFALVAIGFLGYIVWGHHMFQSGMNPILGTTFMASTIMIAVPSAIKTFNWLGTLWGGNIRFTPAMLFAIGFVAMFVIGGLSGIFMASAPVDVHIHDTYFIVAHIHYVFFGGTMMAVFAGLYYWYPKMFGRQMNQKWGVVHFWLTMIGFNGTFFIMHILGLGGHPRRYASIMEMPTLQHLQPLNVVMTIFALMLGTAQLPFVFNFFASLPPKLCRAMAAFFTVALAGTTLAAHVFWRVYDADVAPVDENAGLGEAFAAWVKSVAPGFGAALLTIAVVTVVTVAIVWLIWALGRTFRLHVLLQRLMYVAFVPAFLAPALLKPDLYLWMGHPQWYPHTWIGAAVAMAVCAVPGLLYVVVARPRDEFGYAVGDNPWQANSLEWATTSPPPFTNFEEIPTVYRGPYEYSSPVVDEDYLPQPQALPPGTVEPGGH